MKYLILILLSIIVSTNIYAQSWLKIYDSKLQKWTDITEIEKAMEKSQILFVGEKHDHELGHKVEFNLLQAYWKIHGNIAIAMEMFERDVQYIIDGYLEGQVNKKFFLQHSRPWSNYDTAYQPLVEFAHNLQLKVLAMNVPRRYAGYVAMGKEKFLATFPKLEKSYMADKIVALPGKYRDKFYKTMENHAPPETIEQYYRAQCLKDDTMAKSIIEHLTKYPMACIISYTGCFHSDEGFGLVDKVLKQKPDLRILLVTIIPVQGEVKDPEKYSHLADFIFFAPGKQQ